MQQLRRPGRRFLVVTPCRNEEEHIEATITTMLAQAAPPDRWIIVDDGSDDRTPEILEAAARKHDFIQVVRRTDRGRRVVGAGVIEAFYSGLDTADLKDFDYVCKLDADLELPPRYFQRVLEEMEREPRLGNFSGKVYLRLEDGSQIPERMGDENAIGAAKFYRVDCFEDIGGFVRQAGWDGIDGHMCRLKGWMARSADENELRLIHRRLMGSSHVSVWHGRQRWGRLKWTNGSAPWYILAVFGYRLLERPMVVGALGILWGYTRAMLTRVPRYDYPGYREQVRRFEWLSLIKGKSAAIEDAHSRLPPRQVTEESKIKTQAR